MLISENLQSPLSYVLSQRAAADYLCSLALLPRHPLHVELAMLHSADFEAFVGFFQDFGALMAFAIDDPEFAGCTCSEAYRVRQTLLLHPFWMHAASDLTAQTNLSDSAFLALSLWIH